MPIVQGRNASMQQLNSPDVLNVENNNFCAEWYDGVGGTNFLAATTVPLATERQNAAPEIFTMASNILTIAEAGLYLFNFAVTGANSGSAEMIALMTLDEDPATAVFATVPGTLTYGTWFNGSGTLYNSAVLRVGIAYRYRLSISRIGGSVTPSLVQNASHLSVIRLFKNG